MILSLVLLLNHFIEAISSSVYSKIHWTLLSGYCSQTVEFRLTSCGLSVILLYLSTVQKRSWKKLQNQLEFATLTQTNFTMDWSFIIFLAVWITLQFRVFPKLGIPTLVSINTCRVPESKKILLNLENCLKTQIRSNKAPSTFLTS